MPKFNLKDLLAQSGQEKTDSVINTDQMDFLMVDVKDLIPSKENFYQVDNDLKDNIELMGVLQPLLVKQEGEKYRIISGHRRREACLALTEEGKEQFRSIPCILKESVEDRLALILSNRFREKSDWEKMVEAVELEKLAAELKAQNNLPGRTRDLINDIAGITSGQMARYKAIHNNLIKELMEEFRYGNLKISVVAEICGLEENLQKQALEIYMEEGTLTIQDTERLKELKQVPGQMELAMNPPGETTQEAQSLRNTDQTGGEPQPEKAYIDMPEPEKTEEQLYSEEQDRIDRETRMKLQERQQEEAMQNLPSDVKEEKSYIIPPGVYEDMESGSRTFDLQKIGPKAGDILKYMEYKDGSPTGREMEMQVTYILQDYTGIEDGYCIMAICKSKLDTE